MDHCGCQGAEGIFDDRHADRDLRQYRKKGAKRTTRMLTDALIAEGIEGASLLDIGSGIGAVPHALLTAGAQRATVVDASGAYLRAAQDEAERRGHADRIEFDYGDFVELAPDVPGHDVVTLDRAICCYGDMLGLVSASAERAGRLYGVVVPRDAWWNRAGIFLVNAGLRLTGNSFRVFVHPTEEIERMLDEQGLECVFLRRTLVWRVAVYVRRESPRQTGFESGRSSV